MSFEELLQEHTKALRENTKALIEYTKALKSEQTTIDVEHSAASACRFCGLTFKTLKSYVANGMVTPIIRKGGKREWFKESSLVELCESMDLYSGDYGMMKENPRSRYYTA
jgi:hypothetical protein